MSVLATRARMVERAQMESTGTRAPVQPDMPGPIVIQVSLLSLSLLLLCILFDLLSGGTYLNGVNFYSFFVLH